MNVSTGKLLALTAILALSAPMLAAADELGFEEIVGNDILLPHSYGGFDWTSSNPINVGFDASSDAFFASYGNTYGTPFGVMAGHNNGDISYAITRTGGGDFDFVGAWFTGWGFQNHAVGYTAPSITILGYDDAALVGVVAMSLPTDHYAWLAANFNSVDTLVLINGGKQGQWYLMDNFTFTLPPVQPVPEPATMGLLALGAAGLAVRLHRKKRSAGV